MWGTQMAHCRSLGLAGFSVESCGFGYLRVVLLRENHMRGRGETVKPEIRLRSEVVTFYPPLKFAAGKLAGASVNAASPGSFDFAQQSPLVATALRSASLRMTVLLGARDLAGRTCRRPERAKKSQALRMTTLLGACNLDGWICGRHERAKKSQALRMTTLLGACNLDGWICGRHERAIKSQARGMTNRRGLLKGEDGCQGTRETLG